MALYAIGDFHLSFGSDKPMDIFGKQWDNHADKLMAGFSTLQPEDVCVICGDLNWAMNLEKAREDFLFIDRLPGKKIILKGNHDYWWSTASRARAAFKEWGVTTIDILHNNCFFYNENTAVCGTRGWFFEEETGSAHDKKIMLREVGRLETSLKAAGDREKYVFLHYPPKYGDYACREILELLEKYSVPVCCAGHIHGQGLRRVFEGTWGKTEHRMVSADNVDFIPQKILA
ncbi:MAG: metallophosphoesterase [Candidatus Heteroscillospira sp.]|jgi:predicted phosphohydrolase